MMDGLERPHAQMNANNMEMSALAQKHKQEQQQPFNTLSHWKHYLLQNLKMNRFAYLGRKLHHLFRYSCCKAASLIRFHQTLIVHLYWFTVSHVHPYFIHLGYFIILSLLGYLALKFSKPRTFPVWSNDFNLFFTSVSASTVSGLSVMEMEVLSNNQLIIVTILMLLGGEIFTSLLGLVFSWFNFPNHQSNKNSGNNPNSREDQIELGVLSISDSEPQNKNDQVTTSQNGNVDNLNLKHSSIKHLGYVVVGYLIIVHSVGCIMVSLYLSIVPSAKGMLRNKGLKLQTFAVFTIVSSFANCGLVPTNENMIVLKKNSGLLLLLIPYMLLGNTLYPPCLRLVIWALGKSSNREEFFYILKNQRQMGYYHMLSRFHCYQLVITVFVLFAAQFILFCSLELNSENLEGLNLYQKLVALMFQTVNSRHAGESVLNLSTVSSAILVLVVVMMYMPPYTRFLPIRDEEDNNKKDKKRSNRTKSIMENLLLSQISYLAIFVILICITERDKFRRDPLNFNLLSTTIEVVGAYGNVGFSTGYSCERQLEPDGHCKKGWTGLAGHCSIKGKLILTLVMYFGKLKKFSRNGGKAWALS
ncbi:sodium transporter HKT1-like [Gastrolobium bilobum]|uniref:sodium transporter HKT1-like n=1 Tax=Gastrolobium bilobum TaxID=150636 RepID=UPI002AAF52B7|nr:sodium transporter HKT1-like [Gastrolobium bilobum]